MSEHSCGNFRRFGMECPFLDIKGHDPDNEHESRRIPFALPARRANDEMEDNLRRLPTVAHGQPEMKEALERMAAIQREGGLRSIPRRVPELMPDFGSRKVGDLPFGGRGHPELISILAAIAIMQGLRALRSRGFSPGVQSVSQSEMRSARGLNRASGTSGAGPRSTGTVAGQGFHLRAETFRRPLRAPKLNERDEALKRLLGFKGLRAGFDEFSETGF